MKGSKQLSKIIIEDYDKYRRKYYHIAYGGEQTKECDRELIEYVIKWLARSSI